MVATDFNTSEDHDLSDRPTDSHLWPGSLEVLKIWSERLVRPGLINSGVQ